MKNIAIIPNENKDSNLTTTKKLINELLNRSNIFMEEKFEFLGNNITYLKKEELFKIADCAIVLGGDGTILEAAEYCGPNNVPILGINLGKIGFMTEIDTSEIKLACDNLLSGKYTVEKRMMIKAQIIKNEKISSCYYALNDIVVSKSDASIIMLELYSDKEKINEYRADGLIISTPTGSTGYSLSAGGPVADPTMELFIASPICAHALHARPALMPPFKEIYINLSDELGHFANVTIDGDTKDIISVADKVLITKSEHYVNIIKTKNQSFYDVLTQKLK